jgi:dienelactone hydrolase
LRVFFIFALGLAFASSLAAQTKTNQGSPSSRALAPSFLRDSEEVLFVPSTSNPGIQLETTVFRPLGPGPFPLVVMNHGKAFTAPAKQPRARYPVLSEEFLKRGYAVVIPMRQGFSQSGGKYNSGGCDLLANAREQAKDIDDTVRHFQKQAWIKPSQVIVIGQSHGGLATLGYAAQAAPGVKLLVNFAGGLRSNAGRCQSQWQEQMISAFQYFGEQAKVPSLWFYGQNDSYFEPALVQKIFAAYKGLTSTSNPQKPTVRLVAYERFGQDSHGMVEYSGGVRLWWPELTRELKRLGLP